MQNTLSSVKNRYKTPLSLVLGSIFILSLFCFSETVSEKIKDALSLCVRSVIPSVFPFMVISSFFIKLGGGKILGKMFSLPCRLLFATSDNAACPIVLGFLCGYPIGASSAAALYDRGEISRSEFQRLLMFINNPSSAFIMGAVGVGLFGSVKCGRSLYLSLMLSALTIGIASRFFVSSRQNKSTAASNTVSLSVSRALTEAISESALNMLNICACVAFFSVPSAVVSELFDLNGVAEAAVCGLFEISGGAAASADIGSLTLCASACAWSGLSVFLQVVSVCKGRGISFLPYILSKAAAAVLAPMFVYILSHLM